MEMSKEEEIWTLKAQVRQLTEGRDALIETLKIFARDYAHKRPSNEMLTKVIDRLDKLSKENGEVR